MSPGRAIAVPAGGIRNPPSNVRQLAAAGLDQFERRGQGGNPTTLQRLQTLWQNGWSGTFAGRLT